jgi:hypothetical protein
MFREHSFFTTFVPCHLFFCLNELRRRTVVSEILPAAQSVDQVLSMKLPFHSKSSIV